ncbi:MAG TPA: hypothetical protein DCZ95_00620 [Verrucomicrobia bacterium]|nr:MAG: hypothetical protein A2X46_05740 [Lentisphaerae bacterium GWF2_57_35]HBA82573.1 hypothetical protein [Verrucomicrobiota bacterium]
MNIRFFSCCVVIVLSVLLTAPAQAVTRYVWTNSPSPGGGYTTWDTAAHEIQFAIDASMAGDLILVTNGLYDTGGRPMYTITNRITIDRAVTVRSVNGPSNTVVTGCWNSEFFGNYGSKAVRCAYVGTNATLDGFTLTNGYTGGSSQSNVERNGGGALCEPSGTLTNCWVMNSRSYNNGGGIHGGTALNCAVSVCRAVYYGGGVAHCTLIDGRVANCTASMSGGGVYQGFARDSLIVSNNAYATGGGAYEGVSSNCVFFGNIGGSGENYGGGGVSQGHHYNALFTMNSGYYYGGAAFQSDLHGCTVSNNSAQYGSGVAYSTLSNCVVTRNITSYNGGGAYHSQLIDCRVEWNLAGTNFGGHWTGLGGGLYGGGALNTTITRNEASIRGGGALQAGLTNCIVSHNLATNETGEGQGQSGGCATCYVVGGSIASNRAQTGGGASYSTLIGVRLVGNYANEATNYIARGHGGGAYRCDLAHCVVERNEVFNGANGGGLYQCTATRCYITRNVARYLFGYGYLGSGLGGGAYQGSLSNCVVYYNTGQGAGGGVANGTVTHCTIVDNYSSTWSGGGIQSCTATYSIVYSNRFGAGGGDADNHDQSVLSSCCTLPASGDSIGADPLFVAGDKLFRLKAGSPCIDFLANSSCTDDYSGVPRPLDGNNDGEAAWDIGAHEMVHPSADTDRDAMNDAWELAYTLDPLVNDDALDKDGDRLDNYSEFRAGTDPTNSASFLGLAGASSAGSGLAVSWSSVAGRSYRLNRCQDLCTGEWAAVLSGIAALPPMNTVTDSTAVGSGPWTYRIEVEAE